MSGHSQFKNIMYRKGAQDAKRARIFSKISREITVSVKEGGADSESNARLRSALITARSENMPKDNVDRAIKKAVGGEAGVEYQSVRYEGYGPCGVAIIIEGLTDNKNRTAPEIRSVLSKFGGSLGEANSVNFQFSHVGYITYNKENKTEDEIFELAIDSGADDLMSDDEQIFEIICPMGKMSIVRDAMIKKFGDPIEAKIIWKPTNTVPVSEDNLKTILKMIDVLEDNDDVQSVFANFDLTEHAQKALEK